MLLSKFAKTAVYLLFLCSSVSYGADKANVAWLENNTVTVRSLDAPMQPSALHPEDKVPLGSLWKLFVYIYLADTKNDEPDYVCSNTPTKEDRYCCQPGASIGRDGALAHSCAPYFEPKRLNINPAVWKQYWQRINADWLSDIHQLNPEAEVSLNNLLYTLSIIPLKPRNEARDALLETGLNIYGKDAWIELGSGIRYKTFSWHRHDGKAFGGAAGWLSDGTPFWFGSNGSSRTALTKWSQKLALTFPKQHLTSTSTDDSCVDVSFFDQYPLKAVFKEGSSKKVERGILKGDFRLQFENGNWLSIKTQGNMRLTKISTSSYKIKGRFGLNNYVARVIDREGNTTQIQAARALAIAARTYLIQNGNYQGGCWNITDSSHTQRVSASIPSNETLDSAYFTDDLILQGAPVQYHTSVPAPNRLSWLNASEQSASGWSFEKILKYSYPDASISTINGRMECTSLKPAESWLSANTAKWQSILEHETGYEALDSTPSVCELSDGNPYSDQKRMRIYVRGWQNLNDRIALVHEYLHLAFRYHPNGSNETYIENLARKLTGVHP